MHKGGRIAVVLGTRPEIIKMAEIVKILGDRAFVIHTGQHWDHAMSGTFMEHLELPVPEFSLAVGGNSRAVQIARTLEGLEGIFQREQPAAVMVQGDTNTVLGSALAANACGVFLAHVEAGLRSHDRGMPEEHNRVVTDHLADLCLAPTQQSRANLLAEGIQGENVVVTGNTVVGVVTRALADGAQLAARMTSQFGLRRGDYIVVTIHRPENTDSPEQLSRLLESLAEISKTCPVLFPLHPRTRARIDEYGLASHISSLTVLEPLGYDEFVMLCAAAALVISDSGGIQEEASVWKRPAIVIRRSTERPEVQGTFAHLCEAGRPLVDLARTLYEQRESLARQLEKIPSPYGDGSAAASSVGALDAKRKCK